MKDIIVEFKGWISIEPKKLSFICIDSFETKINGEQWLALDKKDRSNYIIEDVIAAQRDCQDGDYEYVDVSEEDYDD